MSTRIAFLGGGNMAASLVSGLRSAGWAGDDIVVIDRNADKCAALADRHGVTTASHVDAADLAVDAVVLAVKPQVMQAAVADLVQALGPRRPLMLSIAAGIPLAALQRWLGGDFACVRTMPNTPSLLGIGATGLYADDSVTSEQRELADAVMATAGINAWVDTEDRIDAVIATSGSGPAYYFAFMEAMIDGATELGLTPEDARRLVLQTALGAARMAHESGDDPATLRAKVTSKGGTTAEALAHFAEGDLNGLVRGAMRAAAERADVLAGKLSKDDSESDDQAST
ncbi:pyrroline-5-carboxylate reductase [Salinisphaera sp. Q1T1-3]|uniref:pyrroline-5-carboxylate reductase n=1 Tax=Salinisphaera sp. Q1T1-3 TaxID=2321229 RepID=UPI000E742A1F|nr:pyrroline-5-carboxylate reductase [Salinisphaera sp. Q1T1-3]RJS94896.1 pyrroline-5-carboxylate reductase [Salinisphaera sp. Q1T1-3]